MASRLSGCLSDFGNHSIELAASWLPPWFEGDILWFRRERYARVGAGPRQAAVRAVAVARPGGFEARFRSAAHLVLPSFQRPLDASDERRAVEWLGEKTHRAGVAGTPLEVRLGKGRDEDDGRLVVLRRQTALHFEAVRPRHLHVRDDASGLAALGRAEVTVGRLERARRKSQRADEIHHRDPNRDVVVDDGDQGNLGSGFVRQVSIPSRFRGSTAKMPRRPRPHHYT